MFWRQTNNEIKCSNLKLHEEHKLKRNILGRAKIPQQSLQQRPMQYLHTLLLERQMTPGKGRHKQCSGLCEIWKCVKNAISVANEAILGRSLCYTGVSAVPKNIKGKIIVPHYQRLRTKKPCFPQKRQEVIVGVPVRIAVEGRSSVTKMIGGRNVSSSRASELLLLQASLRGPLLISHLGYCYKQTCRRCSTLLRSSYCD